jgi:hypothetical protein
LDPRATEGFLEMADQWLDLSHLDAVQKNTTVFPEYTPALTAAMRGETRSFLESVVFAGDGRLTTLLGASYSFINAPLAQLYGVAGVQGDALRRVELDPSQRRGLLTQASILAANAHSEQTSPVHRGKLVRERLLCQSMPSPPPGVVVTLPPPKAGQTVRERYRTHAENSYCAGCHTLMDPIGLGFEAYDAIGRFRTTEQGSPVDASGELLYSDVDGSFRGVPELSGRLASSAQVSNCVARQWFRYASGRQDSPEDTCSVQSVTEQFVKASLDVRELAVGVTRSDGFRFKKRGAVEACQ